MRQYSSTSKSNLLRFLTVTALFAMTNFSYAAAPEREWTYLVYLNGHNSLDSYGEKDINEMEAVGSTATMNVVVQWASSNNGETRRMLVEKDTDTNKVTSPILQQIPPVDMGDYKSLVEFVKWGMAEFPAKHYFVNIWNHGGGWHMKSLNSVHSRDVSWDDITGHVISTEQLGTATAEIASILGRKIDILGSDSCLMAMAEVGSQISNSVHYFVASEETEPGTGWQYDTFLTSVNLMNPPTIEDVAKAVVNTYVESSSDVTLSVLDLSNIHAFHNAVSALAVNLTTLTPADAQILGTSIGNTLSFAYDDYKDLGDLLNNFEGTNLKTLDLKTITNVREALKNIVLLSSATGALSKATGMSIWLPTNSYQFTDYTSRYAQLAFNVNTGWMNAIQNFVGR